MSRLMKQRLHEIMVSCEAILRYTDERSFADYQRDEMMRDAVERRLGIIGEALRRAEQIDPYINERIPDIRQIVGLRNRLAHGYEAIDNETIWEALQFRLPALHSQVASMLEER